MMPASRASAVWIRIGLVLVVAAGLAYWRWSGKAADSRNAAGEQVRVERGSLDVTIVASAVVQPENRVEVKPPLSGRIESLMVREGDRVRRGQVLAYLSSSERAALLDAARAQGPEVFTRWEAYYKPTPLLAPLAGEIILRNVEAGQTVTGADVIFALSDRLILRADVDETDIGRIRRDMTLRFTLDSYPDETIEGRVQRIAFEGRTISNVTTYPVFIVPARVPAFMKSGMTANVQFLEEHRSGVLLVPAEAVQRRDKAQQVARPSPRRGCAETERQVVRTGATDGRMVEIVDGLSEGDFVCVQRAPVAAGKAKVNPFGFNPPRRSRGT